MRRNARKEDVPKLNEDLAAAQQEREKKKPQTDPLPGPHDGCRRFIHFGREKTLCHD